MGTHAEVDAQLVGTFYNHFPGRGSLAGMDAPPRGEGEESQNRTGQKCTAYELVRRQFFNTIKV